MAKRRRSGYSSGYGGGSSGMDFWPIFLLIWMPLLLWDDDDNTHDHQRLTEAMTAPTAEHAIEHGMKEELAPYFNACQQENGITPEMHDGDYTEAEIERAHDVLSCLEQKHAAAQRQTTPSP